MNDSDLIAWARANTFPIPGCSVNFEALWTADLDALTSCWPRDGARSDYDASSADVVLARFLAYLTQGDRERTWRLMQQSALKRPKWKNEAYTNALLDYACLPS
jgi:hypothetical protein